MADVKFVHLRVHSDYSMCDGLWDVKRIVKTASSMQMAAVAITDYMNQCNTIKLLENTEKCGLKPIYGIDLNVFDDTLKNTGKHEFFRITLLALNDQGYRNIVELQSNAYRSGDFCNQTCVDFSWLANYAEGVLVLSGGTAGDVGKFLLQDRRDLALERLEFYKKTYPNRYYLELHRVGLKDEEKYIALALNTAITHDLPVVATNCAYFATPDDYETHRIRCAIQEKVVLNNKYVHNYTPQMHMRSIEQMCALFADIPEALANTVAIAQRCTVHLHIGKNYLPQFPTGELSSAEYLRREAYAGLEKRLEFLYPDPKERESQRPKYVKRLETELDVIIRMDFPGYFLIVMEFIQWSKDHHIPVGPGRGSGGGSLVAYAIRITDFDPLRYDLLFERFLNPERVSMPDFDVDICMDNRGLVIQHVTELYGRQSVSQIITFGTLAAKASVKAVCRVLGKSVIFGDQIAKMIPSAPNTTLQATLDSEAPFKERYDHDDEFREIVDIAMKLEGITTSHGKHAAGVVISPTVITDFAPLMCDSLGGDFKAQFDKHDVEEAGLVKFDFLGLKTLTIIDWALGMINERMQREGKAPVDISRISLTDHEAYSLLRSTETAAVFQLESTGMRELIGKMQPNCFEDIIALVALYRPGPIGCGMVDNFVNRKHGKEPIAYPHPDFQHDSLRPVLEPTYGVVVYQEQVMQIAQILAGYTLGGADLLRRAMGKKLKDVMAKQRATFKQGAIDKGISGDLAIKIFDQVEKFAEYGFNKSHSAAYALVSFQTLWLKAHYPAEFLAAMMTADKENSAKMPGYIHECKRMKVKIIPPDVNQGKVNFFVNAQGEIVYSLGAIKGVGEKPVEFILNERDQKGPFKDLFDFCQRIDTRIINKKVVEALIWSGALDRLGPDPANIGANRACLFATLDEAMAISQRMTDNKDLGTFDIFSDLQVDEYQFKEAVPYSDKVWLQGEIDSLGVYLSGHPLDRYAEEIQYFAPQTIDALDASNTPYGEEKERVYIAGIVQNVDLRRTKSGKRLLRGTIIDFTSHISFTVWEDNVDKFAQSLLPDSLVVIHGVVVMDSFTNELRVVIEKVMDVVEARLHFGKTLRMTVSEELAHHKPTLAQEIQQCFTEYLGEMPVEVFLETDQGVMITQSEFKVNPTNELMDKLKYITKQPVLVDYAP